jgi:excisionase family DNA binding protein
MSATLSPAADVSGPSAPGGRTTRHKGQVISLAPGAPQLFDVAAVAEMLGCSPRHVYRLSDSGKMPGPVRLGSLVRWSATAIREWIAAGCPSCGKGAGR